MPKVYADCLKINQNYAYHVNMNMIVQATRVFDAQSTNSFWFLSNFLTLSEHFKM